MARGRESSYPLEHELGGSTLSVFQHEDIGTVTVIPSTASLKGVGCPRASALVLGAKENPTTLTELLAYQFSAKFALICIKNKNCN